MLEHEQHEALQQFLSNPAAAEMFEYIEEEILSGTKRSEQEAKDAYYEYKAFQRLLGRFQGIQLAYDQYVEEQTETD